ncbi:MAG: hypothetical protein KA801_06425 [Syntrophorhabdaceae bacterium]|nr:hypothetical protein [Syntrophorhabdaceae bacterium]
MEPFYYPGTMLFLGLLVGAALQDVKRSEIKATVAETISKLQPVVIALVAMLNLSQIMVALILERRFMDENHRL